MEPVVGQLRFGKYGIKEFYDGEKWLEMFENPEQAMLLEIIHLLESKS